jgi:nicotinamidase-related amidase
MRDALLLIDVVQGFDHEDGEALLRSFRERLGAMQALLERVRAAGIPVVYVNDRGDAWDSDAPELLRRALEGSGGDVVGAVAPQPGDPFLLKWRYSVFDHTPLEILLRELDVERLLLAGAATEMCVVQSAIDAREHDFKVTIVADACAAVDGEMERLALDYAKRVVGAFVEREAELQLESRQPSS